MKKVYMPRNGTQLEAIKNLLVSEGIHFDIFDDGSLETYPQIGLVKKRIIQVPEDQAQRATEVIQDYLGVTVRRIAKHALYKGKCLFIETASEQYWNVVLNNGNEPLPNDFLVDQIMQERYIYYGRIRSDDPELKIEKETN